MGPDLNVPGNPTEYPGEKLIRVLVRSPQSLRYWAESKMTGFTRGQLPDFDLSNIIAYLKPWRDEKSAAARAKRALMVSVARLLRDDLPVRGVYGRRTYILDVRRADSKGGTA
jgi:hypothetical protein